MSKQISVPVRYVSVALRMARIKAKISKKSLAKHLGVSVRDLKRFERGVAALPMEILTQLFIERLGNNCPHRREKKAPRGGICEHSKLC